MAGEVRKRVTLAQIAVEANVSKSVASTVLNNAKGNVVVGLATRQRVTEAAERLGYRPDFASRSMARQSTQTLGIYIPPKPWGGLGNQYALQLLAGIERGCEARDYDMLLMNVAGRADPAVCIRKVAERRVDGVLLVHARPDAPWIAQLLDATPNVVAVDYAANDSRLHSVYYDNAQAIRLLVEHLVSLGHRQIGYVGTCTQDVVLDSALRRAALRSILPEFGLELAERWTFDEHNVGTTVSRNSNHNVTAGVQGAEYFAAMPDRPTAIICFNDAVAVSAVNRLQELGLRLPHQMSVAGVGDLAHSRYSRPTLTSVSQPLERMGQRAAELLIDISQGVHEGGVASERFEPELIARQSTSTPYGLATEEESDA